jgi:hypothetical protein
MTIEKSDQGQVVGIGTRLGANYLRTHPTPDRPRRRQPSQAEARREGIHVVMRPIPGLSDKRYFPTGQVFMFQVPPIDSFGESNTRAHNDYTTIGDGEHSLPGSGRSARTVSYSTVFLDWQPTWAVLRSPGWQPNPQQFLKRLRNILDSGRPFRLTATQEGLRHGPDIDWAATLRGLDWQVRAGEDDAYYVTVSFKEFRSATIREFLAGAAQHHKLPDTLDVAHLPKNRNTLHKLATYYYSDAQKFRQIASKNGLKNIPPGELLTRKNTGRKTLLIPAGTAASQVRSQ